MCLLILPRNIEDGNGLGQALGDLTAGLRMDPKDFRVLKAKAHIERVLMGRRNKVLDAHRDRCGGGRWVLLGGRFDWDLPV
jgi:hypothetical protein